jgi:response regulator RpfG family c-di-GMP phosphodiesterase
MPHTLLFVDDEPHIVQSLSLLFDDYTVLTANSGDEALAILKNTPVDVVVSDQRMPQMTGVELLQKVKQSSPNTVRLLLTGYSDLDAVIDSVNAGEIFRYINKPWNSSKLKDTIQLACQFADKLKSAPPPKPRAAAPLTTATGMLAAFGDVKQPAAEAKYSLLFVDPKPGNLQAYKDLLSANYTVHTALSAQDSFTILKQNTVDVLITEVNLGATNTIDFLAAISQEYPEVVVVLLSDSRDANVAIRLINEVQAFRYLVKPFQRQLLKSTVELAISKHETIQGRREVNSKVYVAASAGAKTDAQSASLEEALSRVREIMSKRSTY